jgi:hypothetical protein
MKKLSLGSLVVLESGSGISKSILNHKRTHTHKHESFRKTSAVWFHSSPFREKARLPLVKAELAIGVTAEKTLAHILIN